MTPLYANTKLAVNDIMLKLREKPIDESIKNNNNLILIDF